MFAPAAISRPFSEESSTSTRLLFDRVSGTYEENARLGMTLALISNH